LGISDRHEDRWLWFTPETADCVRLDPRAYPSTTFGRHIIPLPEWVCRAPNGGLHVRGGLGRIDIDVSEPPNATDEINWTCDYGLRILANSWLDQVRDLIDGERIGLGVLRRYGDVLDGWSTVRERHPPPLLSTEGYTKACPNCGHSYSVLHGREFFADPTVVGRSLIVNNSGVFVREDIADSRNLCSPRGSFEPGLVAFEAS
jgi:hypothetical protein